MEYWVGCDDEGRLTALKARMVGDSAYASVGMKVLERAAGHASGPYVLPSIDVESIAARTNNPVGGAFRGFGANQAQFAMEGCIDRLAAEVRISGWEMRRRNVVHPGSIWGPGQIMDDGCLGAQACLDAITPHYDRRCERSAVGLGLGLQNPVGHRLQGDRESVVRSVRTLTSRYALLDRVGQGVNTVYVAVRVEEWHAPERIRVIGTRHASCSPGRPREPGTLMGAGRRDACGSPPPRAASHVDYVVSTRVDWTTHCRETEHPIITYVRLALTRSSTVGRASIRVVAAPDVGRAVTRCCGRGNRRAVHMGSLA